MKPKQTNCHCDVCRRGRDLDPELRSEAAAVVDDDTIILVRQLLSAIARLNGKFGVGVVAEVLAGTENEKTQRWGFNQLTVFGLLRIHSIKKIIAMLHRLMEAGLARQRDPDGVKFRPVVELTAAGIAVMKAQQLPPASLADLLPRRASSSGRRVVPVEGDPSPSTPTRLSDSIACEPSARNWPVTSNCPHTSSATIAR